MRWAFACSATCRRSPTRLRTEAVVRRRRNRAEHPPIAAALLTALAALAACVSCGSCGAPPEARAHSISLNGHDDSDLQFLRALIADRRVVQLGEGGHGVAEFNRVKARLVEFLHRELGFDVLAFEGSPYQCFLADGNAASWPAKTTLFSCPFGVWHTEELLPLFEYIRGTHQGERPLHLAGFDVQPIGWNKKGRPDFLGDALPPGDPATAEEIRRLDREFLDAYSLEAKARREFFARDGQRFIEGYHRVATLLSDSPDPRASVARQTARSMARFVRRQMALPDMRAYVEIRDEGMADNVDFLLDELYPDRRLIVWAHNFHVRHDNSAIPPVEGVFPGVTVRTMGEWLAERRRDDLYTIGLYAYTGSALNNRGEPYEIEEPAPTTLEGVMHSLGSGVVFVDLSAAERHERTNWMFEEIIARYNGSDEIRLVPRDQYDGLLLVDLATPRKALE